MICSNSKCKEESPVFYKGAARRCKECKKIYQRKYRKSPAGEESHAKSDRTYWQSKKGREKAKSRMDEWLKWRKVTKWTLQEGIPFRSCEECAEVFAGRSSEECPVAYGSESLSVCEVWREWGHSGVHPLVGENESIIFMESPYNEEEETEFV